MTTLTRDEQATIAGNSRSLESIAEKLLEAARIAEEVEDADDLDGIVRLLHSAYDSLRWLHGDLDRLNDNVQDRGELCDECTCDDEGEDGFLNGNCDPEMAAFMVAQGEVCGTCGHNLCPDCGECPSCGDCECGDADEEQGE